MDPEMARDTLDWARGYPVEHRMSGVRDVIGPLLTTQQRWQSQ